MQAYYSLLGSISTTSTLSKISGKASLLPSFLPAHAVPVFTPI
jgi:hypothetical protein